MAKKSYKDYLILAVKADERAKKALDVLAIRIGKDVIKTNPEIMSFKDYEEMFKVYYLQAVDKVEEDLKAAKKAGVNVSVSEHYE